MKTLSKRLAEVARQVPRGAVAADIGSDHGNLPIHLVRSGVSPRCVAIEVVPGPCNVVRQNVLRAGLQSHIDVRLGDGLEPLLPGEVEAICIAGMGGATIAAILERGHMKLRDAPRLILQPNGGDAQLRRHLIDSGWQIVHEHALLERGRFYTIITAEVGDPRVPYQKHTLREEALIKVGPLLLRAPNDAMRQRWQTERAHLSAIATSLADHPTPRNVDTLARVRRDLQDADAILDALNHGTFVSAPAHNTSPDASAHERDTSKGDT